MYRFDQCDHINLDGCNDGLIICELVNRQVRVPNQYYIRDMLLGWCFAYIRHLVLVPFVLARCVLCRLDLIILAV